MIPSIGIEDGGGRMADHEAAVTLLKKYFGYEQFRRGQDRAIDALLTGRDVLCVMPTGVGKSICYQLSAMALPGVTLVISPLISLMKDQVSSLLQVGIKAAYINSSLTAGQYKTALRRAAEGQYKIIYVAPERLLTDGFLSAVRQMDISLIAVDEAHCVSQWGQDFRPGYLDIGSFVETLPRRPVVGAFTATATEKVRADIQRLLQLENPCTLTTGFNRENLYYQVRRPDQKLRELERILEQRREHCGIVYCATRKNVELVTEHLRAKGYEAAGYHAGMSDTQRGQNQEAFQYDRVHIIVATNAFGMGIDKANVSFVIHYNMPKNIESYYQEVGRAGRDGSPADCILLYSGMDVRTNQFLIEKSAEDREGLTAEQAAQQKEKEYELLKYMTWYATTSDCLRGYILRYFGEEAPGYCGDCGNCRGKFEEVDATLPARKALSCILRLEERRRSVGKRSLAEFLHGGNAERTRWIKLFADAFHGSLAQTPVQRICDIIDRLTEEGLLAVRDGQFPVLATTERTEAFLEEEQDFMIRVPIREAETLTQGEPEEGLLHTLKQLRTALAKRASVPAYVIFSDATLREMCVKKPQNDRELLQISGVGENKLKKYGAQFLEAITAFQPQDG